ncbi:hypothetical protein GmHk_12G034563 [Glycine max]|nr:hypothetical protein GmHk_12G034563 [Glycine max]
MYNELQELSMQRNLFQISFWVLFARERCLLVFKRLRTASGDVVPINLEIEATCRCNNAARRRREQDTEGSNATLAQNKLLTRQIEALTETLNKLPQQLQAVEGCPTCGGTHEPGQCVSQQDTSREVNYMGVPNCGYQGYNQGNSSGFHQGGAGFNHGPPGFNQGRNFTQGSGWRNQGNQNQQPYQPPYQHPSQGPNQQDKPTNIEELLLQFIQETRSHQKSTDAAIRNLENPKEECKAVLTRGQRKAQEEGKVEEEDQTEEDRTETQEERTEEEEKMASRKRHAVPTPGEASNWDTSRFTSEIAWHRYQDNIQLRNILPERNVELGPGMFDEFLQELRRRRWDQVLTHLPEKRIDVALVKEFYSNLYDPEDHSPRFCRVRGQVVRFDGDTINNFLDTPVILEDGEEYPAYTRYLSTHPDPDTIAATLCTPGGRFVLNADGLPWKLLRKDMTTLAQTWSVLSYYDLVPTSHTSDVNLDRARLIYSLVSRMDMDVGSFISQQISQIAQSSTSRLGFPALITTLCDIQVVVSDTLIFESLSPAINLAYVKKNCWNPADPSITFPGPRRTRTRASASASETPLSTQSPSQPSQRPRHPPASTSASMDTHGQMLRSLHVGQQLIMENMHRLSLHLHMDPPLTTLEAYRDQPSTDRGEEPSGAAEDPAVDEDLIADLATADWGPWADLGGGKTKSKRGVKRKVLRGNKRVKKKASEMRKGPLEEGGTKAIDSVETLRTCLEIIFILGLLGDKQNVKNEDTFSKSSNRKEEKEEILKQAQPNRGAKRASGAKRATNYRR